MKYRRNAWIMALALFSAFVLSACEAAAPQDISAEFQGEVKIDLSTGIAEFSGSVDEISAIAWTVAGVDVGITPQTQIKGDLTPGDLAKVEASIQEDGSLLALEIKPVEAAMDEQIEERDLSDEYVEFTGAVETMTDGLWTVAGVDVIVTDQTEIKGSLQLGDQVKVEARQDGNGLLTAREIKLADAEEHVKEELHGDEIEFIGIVESMTDELWIAAGTEFFVTPQTEIKGNIQVGDLVKVEAVRAEDGSLTAREIKLPDDDDLKTEDMHEDEIEFTGFVESMSENAWSVAGIEFFLTPQTEIEGNIQIGDLVKVEAVRAQDGSLIAREIKLADDDDLKTEDMHDDEIEFTGFVESMSENLWSVAGLELVVTSQTEIDESIQVGDLVKVEAMRDVDGALVALEIESADDDDLEDEDDDLTDDHDDDDHDDEDHDDDDHDDDDHENDDHDDEDLEDQEDDD